jgi:hypothetical protein
MRERALREASGFLQALFGEPVSHNSGRDALFNRQKTPTAAIPFGICSERRIFPPLTRVRYSACFKMDSSIFSVNLSSENRQTLYAGMSSRKALTAMSAFFLAETSSGVKVERSSLCT